MSASPIITSFHEAIAEAHGIGLYERYNEAVAASVLKMSAMSLRRIRTAGRIGHLRLSPRKIDYFGYHLVEYLLQSVEARTCPDTRTKETSRSETIGSPSVGGVTRGVERGSIPKLDKRAVQASALRILKQPSKR